MGNFMSCICKILAKTVLIESAFKGKKLTMQGTRNILNSG